MRHITRAATCGGAALPVRRAAHRIARSLAIRSRSAGGARSSRSLLRTRLVGADLTGAVLRGVRAPETWFTNAKLVGADLTGAVFDGSDCTRLTFKLACQSEGKGPTSGTPGSPGPACRTRRSVGLT